MKVALAYMDRALDSSGLSMRHVTSDPLGLRYLAGNLERDGHEVSVHLQGPKSVDEVAEEVLSESPEVVGLSCLTYNTLISQKLAGKLKESDKGLKIVFGGEHPSLSPETTFTEDIDFVVKGEGELTLSELLGSISRHVSPKGVYYVENGKIVYGGDRPSADINSLAWPLRDENIVKSTRMNSLMYPSPENQTGLATFLGSRGCSFSCIYCSSHKLWGNRTRFRDVADVADEIENVERETSANVGVFYDLTFNSNPNWVSELCGEMIKRRIGEKISFYSTCRVSAPNGKPMLTRTLLRKMKESGFSKIGIGIESTNDEIARQYKAGKSPWENTVEAVNNAHGLGILVRGFLMIGGPMETPQTYEQTKARLNGIPLHDLRVGYATPFPGTTFHISCPADSRFTMDLSKYDCSMPIIMNHNFAYSELVAMERELLGFFHGSSYRQWVIGDIIKREPRLEGSVEWRKRDLEGKGLK